MSLRRTAVILAVAGLAACRDSTSPAPAVPITDAPVLGATLTIAGASALSGSTASSIGGSLSGNPFALTAGATLPPSPTCSDPLVGVVRCSITLNGLTISYAFGWQEPPLGTRLESQLSGTLPASGSRPAQRIERSATIWTQPLTGGSATAIASRHRSIEYGVTEQSGARRVVMTDTANADIRTYLTLSATTPAARIPRMVGSSTRVIWTSTDGAAPVFWRETTTYDSSAVVRSTIATPSGTRQCSIDLAAPVAVLTCR